MKQKAFVLVLVLVLAVLCMIPAFAGSGTTISGAFNYDFTTGQMEIEDITLDSINQITHAMGFDVTLSSFFNEGAFGLYVNGGMHKLVSQKTKSGDDSWVTVDYTDEMPPIFFLGIGPAVRIGSGSGLSFIIGAGIAAQGQWKTYEGDILGLIGVDGSITRITVDAFADVKVQFGLTDSVFLTGGAKLAYNFAQYNKITGTAAIGEALIGVDLDEGWAEGYSTFSLTPYVGVGIGF